MLMLNYTEHKHRRLILVIICKSHWPSRLNCDRVKIGILLTVPKTMVNFLYFRSTTLLNMLSNSILTSKPTWVLFKVGIIGDKFMATVDLRRLELYMYSNWKEWRV